jgi:acyl-CoA dehydrogenase
MGSLTDGRMGVSCSCIGAADRLFEMCVEHADLRSTFGKRLAERPAIQWMLADNAIELRAARAMTYGTLRQIEAGRDAGAAACMCKVYCPEMVGRVADRAVQSHGGMGLVRGFPVERFYRDIHLIATGDGASAIAALVHGQVDALQLMEGDHDRFETAERGSGAYRLIYDALGRASRVQVCGARRRDRGEP